MRRRLFWRAFVLLLTLALACGREEGRPTQRTLEENAALGGEVAARVGAEPIPLSVVSSVARAQKVTGREAARRIVDDEIAASAARARGLDQRTPASWRLVAARGRFTSDRLLEEARRQGPPTDEEIKLLSERHWVEVDRPPAVRVVHAIVLRPSDAALLPEARSLAGEMGNALVSAPDVDTFEKNANAVIHSRKLEARVEKLPAFTEEGWVTEGGGRMNEIFARAAFAVPSLGGTSPIVETEFGWHIIRLVDRIPERRMPIETRRIAFAEEAYSVRAHDLFAVRVKPLRDSTAVAISPGAAQLMQSVSISSPVTAGTP